MKRSPWLLLLVLPLVGCPLKSKAPVIVAKRAIVPTPPPPPQPAPPRLVHLQLTPALVRAKPFKVGEVEHEVKAELIRLEVLDGPAGLEDEGLHPKTLGEMKQAGGGSFLVCVIEVTVDGKPLQDPSVKGTFRSIGTEFSYGGRVFNSVRGYIGPAKGRPNAHLHVSALEAVRGDGDWGVTQSLYLADGTKVELEFSGSVKLPDAG